MISKINNPEVIQFIQDHINDDPAELILQSKKFTGLPIREIAIQIASRKKAKNKLTEWYDNQQVIFPPKENLEQASSELTAKFKARWITGEQLVDVTGGTGIDLFYISKSAKKTVYVDPNKELCELAKHNFSLFQRQLMIYNCTAEEFLADNNEPIDMLYIDPSRRDINQKKVFGLEEYQPNVVALYPELLKTAKEIIIKTSPMIDIKNSIIKLPDCYRVQVVAVENEVKEVLFYISEGKATDITIEAWNLSINSTDSCFSFYFSEEKEAHSEFSASKQFIYEPNSAIRKAGAFSLIGSRYGLTKLHPNTHLYTSEERLEEFPGRIFKLEELIKPNKKGVRNAFPKGIVNVISKNFPMSANQIKSKFSIKDGGDEFLIFFESMNQKTSARCSLVHS